jgi:regulation of enolase protein 1 (concanavalin A-like superfamily)
LEEADEDPAAFRGFCRRLQEEDPAVGDGPLVQWYLEPTQPDLRFSMLEFGLPTSEHKMQNSKSKIQNREWVWHNPLADCSFAVQNGLEIRAANARDLWRFNRSAPRLLRAVSRDFAVQAVCRSMSADTPAIGGILLWRDKENYLRLERGVKGPHEVSFHGWLRNKAANIGRGRLATERLFLRLERRGPRVHALCSADGQHWFTVGHVELAIADPVEIGLHAIGNIDRLIYPGAYPEGTAIRFESFGLWTNGER